MDTKTLAYAAGIIDGEGCVSIAKVNPTKGNRRTTPGYELYVTVKSTDLELIAWLRSTFAGNVTDHAHDKSRQVIGWKPPATWRITSKQAADFLALMLPYLKIKHVIASLAIEFQQYKTANPLTFKDGLREEGILEREEAFYQHLNSLHYTRKTWEHSESLDERARQQSILNAVASPLTREVIAYAAGLFDGEGCTRVSVRRPDGKAGKGHLRQPSYRLTIKVANTDRSIIEWLRATFDGHMGVCNTETSRNTTGNNPAWEWRKESGEALDFLELVTPYLHTKRKQAELASEFQQYRAQYRYVQGTRPQEVLDRLEWYRQSINNLNAKPATASQPASPEAY